MREGRERRLASPGGAQELWGVFRVVLTWKEGPSTNVGCLQGADMTLGEVAVSWKGQSVSHMGRTVGRDPAEHEQMPHLCQQGEPELQS